MSPYMWRYVASTSTFELAPMPCHSTHGFRVKWPRHRATCDAWCLSVWEVTCGRVIYCHVSIMWFLCSHFVVVERNMMHNVKHIIACATWEGYTCQMGWLTSPRRRINDCIGTTAIIFSLHLQPWFCHHGSISCYFHCVATLHGQQWLHCIGLQSLMCSSYTSQLDSDYKFGQGANNNDKKIALHIARENVFTITLKHATTIQALGCRLNTKAWIILEKQYIFEIYCRVPNKIRGSVHMWVQSV